MRFPGRTDLFLLAGLTAALLVSAAHPLGRVLLYAREMDTARGLQLLPALLILAAVFTFVQIWKRRQERHVALGAAADARHATERLAEMQRLVALGQALARSLDEDAIRAAASAHLALLAPGRGVWALV